MVKQQNLRGLQLRGVGAGLEEGVGGGVHQLDSQVGE